MQLILQLAVQLQRCHRQLRLDAVAADHHLHIVIPNDVPVVRRSSVAAVVFEAMLARNPKREKPHTILGYPLAVSLPTAQKAALERCEMTPGTLILDPLFSRNFGGLVLLCIEADFCDQILILQHLSRTTKFYIPSHRSKRKIIAKIRMKIC